MGAAHSKRRDSLSQKDYRYTGTGRPSPPGKPFLVPNASNAIPDVVTIQWEPPFDYGGSRIIGYLVEHRRTGSPHWVRATPSLVKGTELILSGLEPGWRYHFRVSAENASGISDPSPLSEPMAVTYQRNVASAPFFYQELLDTTALENEKVEFTVRIQGTPSPQIAWYHDGFEIFSNRRQRIVTEGDTSSLVIYEAAMADEGEIKCTATNRAGHAVSRAKLVLEAPPTIRLSRQYEDGLLFEKDEIIRLKVHVSGRPPPMVSWYHNGELLPHGGRYEICFADRYATLRVAEGKRSDRGEYTVRAYNNISEDTASFLVTVTDRPEAPESIQVVMTLGRSVTLSWSEPKDDGGCKIGNYIIEYNRIGWNVWLKAATCRQLSTTLVDLIEGSKYRFRVKAENPYGVSEPSRESDIIFIPDPKRGLLDAPRVDASNKPGGTDEEGYLSGFDDLAIAPPMSLSAPELGSCDYPEYVEVRNAVSSTELLHEKAMARFYQAFTEDEVERIKKLERRHSFGSRSSLGKNKQHETAVIENRLQKAKSAEKGGSATKEARGDKIKSSEKKEHGPETRRVAPQGKVQGSAPEVVDKRIKTEPKSIRFAMDVEETSIAPEVPERRKFDKKSRENRPGGAEPSRKKLEPEGRDHRYEPDPGLTREQRSGPGPGEKKFEPEVIDYRYDRDDRLSTREYRSRPESEVRNRRYEPDPGPTRERPRQTRSAEIEERRFAPAEKHKRLTPEMNRRRVTPDRFTPDRTIAEPEILSLKLKQPLKLTFGANIYNSSIEADEGRQEDEIVEEEEEEEELADYDYLTQLKNRKPLTSEVFDENEELEEFDDEFAKRQEELRSYRSEHAPKKSLEQPYAKSVPPTKPSSTVDTETYHPRNMIPIRQTEIAVPQNTLNVTSAERSRSRSRSPSPRAPPAVKPPQRVSSLQPANHQPNTFNEIIVPPDVRLPSINNLETARPNGTKTKSETNIGVKSILKRRSSDAAVDVASGGDGRSAPIAFVEAELNLVPKALSTDNFGEETERRTGRRVRIEEPESTLERRSKSVNFYDKEYDSQYDKPVQKISRPVDSDPKSVLISHYSDIVREFGRLKKAPKTLYLNYEDLKAAAQVSESTSTEKGGLAENSVSEKQNEEEIQSAGDEEEVKLPEAATASVSAKTEEAYEASVPPPPMKVLTPEEEEQLLKVEKKVSSICDYILDLCLFLVACYLYFFDNPVYSIPFIILMLCRQMQETVQEKIQRWRKRKDD